MCQKDNISGSCDLSSRMCDMLFTATSHPLAEFIIFLDNHCQQLIDMGRIDVKEHGKKSGKDLLASVQVIGRIVSYDSPPYHKKAKPIIGSASSENRSNSRKNIQQLRKEAVISAQGVETIESFASTAWRPQRGVLIKSVSILYIQRNQTQSCLRSRLPQGTWKEEMKLSSCFCVSDWKFRCMERSGPRSSRPYAFIRGRRGIQYLAIVKSRAEHFFEVINSRDDFLSRFMRWCVYLRYVEARVANRFLYADQILKDGFCLNMIKTPLCPLKILKNMQEAVRDDDIVINGLPQTKQF
ncbi:hypothetical protein F2Q70_00027988 [Brassica cretica]|uniref:Uncharacterized protein n=1 Tax=Brassica cretica TaxID=69181 RepID=A0A8S9LE83_BRACR|nr:hypothetical protein F2Q70_00027988 [Brassica cretica]